MLDNPLNAPDAGEHAARLRIIADTVEDQSRRLDLRVDGMHFEGPAARHMRANMADRRRRAQRVADDLRELAARLQSTAREI